MDQNRQIRFLIPPFLLLISLFFGEYLGWSTSTGLVNTLIPQDPKVVAIIVALAAGAVLPMGFLIAAISGLVLGISFKVLKYLNFSDTGNYEVGLLKLPTLAEIDRLLNPGGKSTESANSENYKDILVHNALSLAATFDHSFLSQGVHEWIMRRWNYFNTCFNSLVALLLSHAVGSLFNVDQSSMWWFVTIAAIVILAYNGRAAYCETMAMFRFQAKRLSNNETLLRTEP